MTLTRQRLIVLLAMLATALLGLAHGAPLLSPKQSAIEIVKTSTKPNKAALLSFAASNQPPVYQHYFIIEAWPGVSNKWTNILWLTTDGIWWKPVATNQTAGVFPISSTNNYGAAMITWAQLFPSTNE